MNTKVTVNRVEFMPEIQEDILRALRDRSPIFAAFADGAIAVPVIERIGFFLLVIPANAGGPAAAHAAFERSNSLHQKLPIGVPRIWLDLSRMGNGEEGLLLSAGPPQDRCTPITTLPDAQRDTIVDSVRTMHPALDAVIVEDIWFNTETQTPFLIRTDRVHLDRVP